MTHRLTLFTATLVQDSALSISGVDRESTSDRPFTVDANGKPLLSGRGLKGAAVAMARRFFDPLPRSVSDDVTRAEGLCRSAWEFANAMPGEPGDVRLRQRAGVGILQKTGARASGVLYDLETVSAGTRWGLVLRVDWSWAGGDGNEAEGILSYVLKQHWTEGRCWLGGDVARGLGWCHLEDLRGYRLDKDQYDTWVTSGRKTLPAPIEVPCADPTRTWHFRSRQVWIAFGEYRPTGEAEAPWGLDMMSVGPHDSNRSVQSTGSGMWARPAWGVSAPVETEILTDRSVAMSDRVPLLPGASVRGPMRHAFSRAANSRGQAIQDPHLVQGDVGEVDLAGKIFGTVKRSSQLLICDALAQDGWAGARLHMHAEDEFSAGSYGSAKRDAVRLLRAEFPVRILVEGAGEAEVDAVTTEIDKLIALGALGHLPIGGHKTHGAGWGRWNADPWQKCDVVKKRTWVAAVAAKTNTDEKRGYRGHGEFRQDEPVAVRTVETHGTLDGAGITVANAIAEAGKLAGDRAGRFVAWWCEPTIDVTMATAPEVFGWQTPANGSLPVDEVAVFFEHGVWRAARTSRGVRWVLIRETDQAESGAEEVTGWSIPARLHGDETRFQGARLEAKDHVMVWEWRSGAATLGFTLKKGQGR